MTDSQGTGMTLKGLIAILAGIFSSGNSNGADPSDDDGMSFSHHEDYSSYGVDDGDGE